MKDLKTESVIRDLTTSAVVAAPVSISQVILQQGAFPEEEAGLFSANGSQPLLSFVSPADASPQSATSQADSAHPLKDHSEQEFLSNAFDLLPVDAISPVLSGDDFLAEAIELLDRSTTPEALPKTFDRDTLELIDIPVASLDATEYALSILNIRQDVDAPDPQAPKIIDPGGTPSRIIANIDNALPQTGIIGDLLSEDGLLGGIIGPSDLVDDLIGRDNILSDLLGNDGVLNSIFGADLLGLSSNQEEHLEETFGSQAGDGNIVDFILDDNAVVGSLIGSDGLLGNILNDIVLG